MTPMTSRERLLTALRRARPDRVPVTLYEHSPHADGWANQEPSYAPLLELESRYGDGVVFAPVDCPVFLGDPNAVREPEGSRPGAPVILKVEVETPRGPLRASWRRDPGMMTNWQVEPLVKSDEDIERVLSMPEGPAQMSAKRIRELQERLGDKGILCFSVGDALGHVVGLFDFEDFVLRSYGDDGPIRALLEKSQSLVLRAIRETGALVKDCVFRLWGPEYAGAPLMNPHVDFKRYVVEQDKEATALVHSTGNLSVIHCHGKLRDILGMIGEIGADALEPIETLPLPTADVTLAEVKQRLGGKMCLMGGVQARTLEAGTPADVRLEVARAIEEAAEGGGLVILPTAAPFKLPLDARCLENARAMYLAAHELGHYG